MDAAVAACRAEGLVPDVQPVDTEDSSSVGHVIRQEPCAGEVVKRGAVVILTVGRAAASDESASSTTIAAPLAADLEGEVPVIYDTFAEEPAVPVAAAAMTATEIAGGPSYDRDRAYLLENDEDHWFSAAIAAPTVAPGQVEAFIPPAADADPAPATPEPPTSRWTAPERVEAAPDTAPRRGRRAKSPARAKKPARRRRVPRSLFVLAALVLLLFTIAPALSILRGTSDEPTPPRVAEAPATSTPAAPPVSPPRSTPRSSPPTDVPALRRDAARQRAAERRRKAQQRRRADAARRRAPRGRSRGRRPAAAGAEPPTSAAAAPEPPVSPAAPAPAPAQAAPASPSPQTPAADAPDEFF